MRLHLKALVTVLCLVLAEAAVTQPAKVDLSGRWQVKFAFAGRSEMNLIFHSKDKGSGTFLLLDTGPDGKAETSPRSATWTQTSNNRVSFSGEVELPIGSCCRETGTLIFKSRFSDNNSFSGKVIFVGSTEDEENPIGFRAMIGVFTATRIAAAK